MKKLILSIFVVLASLTLVACGGEKNDEIVAAAKEQLKVKFSQSGDSLTNVTGKIILDTKVGDVVVTWESNKEDVVSVTGEVTRGAEDVNVNLTATLTLADETAIRMFTITVKAIEPEPSSTETVVPSGSETVIPSETESELVLPAAFTNAVEGKKVYVTSIGQSGDIATIEILIKTKVYTTAERGEYMAKVTIDTLLAASAPEEGSIVILVPAASGKGLGAAGTNIAKEQARAEAFGQRAKDGEIELYVVHTGGRSRRGTDTDPLIQASVEYADLVMILNDSDYDGFFSGLVLENLFKFEASMDMVEPFKQIFNKHEQ